MQCQGAVGRALKAARLVGTGRPVVPRGELAGAWPPCGVRALASVRHGAREQERGAEVGRAGLCGWAESEARGLFKEK